MAAVELKTILVGQVSEKGMKAQNEDSLGCLIPDDATCFHKGIVAVIADGVSTAEAGKEASETCVKNFLSDYFSTPDSWTVKTSVQRILTALNRWLYSQSIGKYETDRGYISTLSAIVLHGDLVHVFHIGDSRVYRLRDSHFEQLTRDHCRQVNKDTCYLTRAMGMDINLEVDYFCTSLEAGDTFFLSTDGVHGFVSDNDIKQTIQTELAANQPDFQACCDKLIQQALAQGSDDNLSCQLVQFHLMPYLLSTKFKQTANHANVHLNFLNLPFLGEMSIGESVDGLWILDVLSREALFTQYLVKDVVDSKVYVMRAPSKILQEDAGFKAHFVLEPWAANIVKHPGILGYPMENKFKHHFYYLSDYVPSPSLKEWLHGQKRICLEDCLDIVKQLIEIVNLLHQKDIILLNLSLDNILLTKDGRIKLTDFGACYIQGMAESRISAYRNKLATVYCAPEFLTDEKPVQSADVFSISVIAYQLMTRSVPYGKAYLKCSALTDFYKLNYVSATHANVMIPGWLDSTLKRGLSLLPRQRFASSEALSEAFRSPVLEAADKSSDEKKPYQWKVAALILFFTQLISLIILLQ